jgi:phosphomannomutase / phosphoglucomutase
VYHCFVIAMADSCKQGSPLPGFRFIVHPGLQYQKETAMHSRPTDCFCTYDVRAIVIPGTFDELNYQYLGQAFTRYAYRRLGKTPLVVAMGYDARTHSPALFDALKQAVLESGATVINVGLQPSPMMYAMEHLPLPAHLPRPNATLTVTASHNPGEYNGLKWTLEGHTLSREEIMDVKALYAALQEAGKPDAPTASSVGREISFNPLKAYIAWHTEHLSTIQTPMKVVVDAGNGTGGVVAPALLQAFGVEVIPLFIEPDGTFPNHHPDPSKAKNLKALQETVLKHQATAGMAFDGDSDRLGVVDDKGTIITGDFAVLLFAQAVSRHHQQASQDFPHGVPKVVSEIKASQHVFDGIARLGLEPVISPTGHAHIKGLMKRENAMLGGELSGHFFFKDKHWGFDDAFYAMLRMLHVLEEARALNENPALPLSELVEALPVTYAAEEIRYPVNVSHRQAIMQALVKHLQGINPFGPYVVSGVSTLDGIRVNFNGGFALVRSSNTEPVLTLRWEAPEEEGLEQVETVLLHEVNKVVDAVYKDEWV